MLKIVVFIFLFVLTVAYGQEVNGVVVDSVSQTPIPFASIVYDGGTKAINTNELGEFKILSMDDSIVAKSMGFRSKKMKLAPTMKIDLAPKETELAEIVIRQEGDGETPREVMFKAYENLKKNYGTRKTEYKAFYRHYCKEDTAYGRLIEAAITMYDPKGHKTIVHGPKNKLQVKVDEIRRSYDYTKNFSQHDPISIYNTIKYDVTSYQSIHMAVPEEHNYRFIDTTYYDGHWVYVIGYNYTFVKQGARPITFENEGKIYINTSDYAILKVQEHQEASRPDVFIKYTYNLDWEVNYTHLNDIYHLTYAKESGHNVDYYYNNEDSLLYTKDHLFHVEIMVNGINDVSPKAFKGEEPSKKELDKMKYHPGFWETFPVIKDSPLNAKIVEDLQRQSSLKEQFDKEN